MVAPHLGTNPACCTAGKTPSSSRTGMLAGSNDSPIWSRGKCSRSRSSTCQPLRASIVAVVLPPGPPPMTTTSAVMSALVIPPSNWWGSLLCVELGTGAMPVLLRAGSGGLGRNGLAGSRINLKGARQFQFLCHLSYGRNDLLAHESQATHSIVVRHGTITVPEKDAAGPDVLQDMPDLGQDCLGRARDDGVILELPLVGAS